MAVEMTSEKTVGTYAHSTILPTSGTHVETSACTRLPGSKTLNSRGFYGRKCSRAVKEHLFAGQRIATKKQLNKLLITCGEGDKLPT